MKLTIPAATAAVALLLSSTTAFSQTQTGDMAVSMTVAAECTIATEALAFGTVGIIDTNIDAEADLTVQCTSGSAYQISLSDGAGDGATTAARLLTNTVTIADTATYSLYQDAGRATLWGNTAGTNTVDSDTATGADEVITVYGRVDSGQNVATGTYQDTVVATISYGTGL
ncbi:spore coat U domain-containing protein [Rhizobium sp. CG5]|uniref:Csu type fimbrial protein n=1 Tax=Rhizobium sp. CG5 TaxID=2726076 RepID=UPI00203486F1|nr:spore coat U domain-containing protein [Rhizobium sp. CG5]